MTLSPLKPVTRLFLISISWTFASLVASSFMGAWFWDIGTGLAPIIIFYIFLFIIMTASFAYSSRGQGRVSSSRLMVLGIILNILYLALLLILQTHARYYFIPLAIIEGLSASFYWLALFVLAAAWIKQEQADWYNGWTGTFEALLGLLAPLLSGWLIATLPGIAGYRIVFLLALISLGLALILALGGNPTQIITTREHSTASRHNIKWRPLLWSFWALGMRDGIYFFIPSLLLYIVTHNSLLLGLYMTMQAAIEGAVFWMVSRATTRKTRLRNITIASIVSLGVPFLMLQPLSTPSLFALGILIALAYPPFKVVLESTALVHINQHSQSDSDRIQLTGIKETWINSGRLLSLVLLLLVMSVLPHNHFAVFRWFFAVWCILPLVIFFIYRHMVGNRSLLAHN